MRVRYDHTDRPWVAAAVEAYEIVDAVFSRRMLVGLRRRAEGPQVRQAGGATGPAGGTGRGSRTIPPPTVCWTTPTTPRGSDMATTTPAERRMRETTIDEALALLRTASIGRLVYTAQGEPRVLPLNYVVHQGAVVFRTSYGHLLDHIHLSEVLFEADEADPETQTGWSVIVHGRAEEIWRSDDLDVVRGLPLRPWAPGVRDHFVRIVSTRITGRVIS